MHHRELMADCTALNLNRVSSMLLDEAKDCVSCDECYILSPFLPVNKCLENLCDKIRADDKRQLNTIELKAVSTAERPTCEMRVYVYQKSNRDCGGFE